MNKLDFIESKIISTKNLQEFIKSLKANNETIVFTNGCFDILHYGHINYLAQAADLGSKLIIGLNSDSSVKKLKGENRPINKEMERAFILASLFFVDAIIIFEEDTPEKLIQEINPNILVKGGDYKIDEIAGANFVLKNGGKVEIIKFVDGYSSTKIINKVSNI
ncbi:MAG: D-glycero-beta-D-manno-heptose 1-phosphate adenylyltransferase [Bacteroidales bacterium]|jgi:rfaE bifunctional protein nucleotidyltransferase chain/domain|nr:D-glycero-beta-D-manno-heptose 1-phosphate adenylyltransferase [Bacteroidales bacterium]MCK9498810.1 D-glycero-beta-D-manno-heptose 1-phosphate adenylyltransferase [Bacteroidales bacterium]MDY0313980.1 D-glycero-beta-D-manno-heptose 1-phosphate adenylyltransferase [Bacteroidales bacterium]NLB86474.1 D-glycero-beta-D-manno-heptose 1-phosphate adenylyltransferase [Bacteroidales bacterium]